MWIDRTVRARRLIFLLAAILGTAGCAPAPTGGETLARGSSASGYDLLLISVDTLRADRLGCYGHAAASTPIVDGLAANGIRFEQATTAVPITLPAHASMMTGLDPPNHGVRHNGTFRLDDEQTTLAERLRAAGYATAAFVGAYVLDGRYGLDQGFDHYDDNVNPQQVEGLRDHYNERPASEVTRAAADWLKRRLAAPDAGPFMVWAHYFDPHAPYDPPPGFRDGYDGEIAFADEQIGILLELLREHGRLDRTLVVFTSDHGEGLGEHDEQTHANLIYESTMRVPLILSAPGAIPAGRIVGDRIAATVDIVPTVLSLLGVELRGPALDGRDLLGEVDADRAIYTETLAPLLDYGWSALHGLRRLDDKFILAPSPEYYDLEHDAAELNNAYGNSDSKALERRLQVQLRSWVDDSMIPELEEELDPEQIERLASLGYVRGAPAEAELGVKDPKTMMGLRRRMDDAVLESARGNHAEAVAAIQAILREDPHDGKAWYLAAQIHERGGSPNEAEAALRRALGLSPRADGWVHLARFALGRGDLAAFESALTEAERLDPREGGIYFGRGMAHAQAGRFTSALAAFEQALSVDPVRTGPRARRMIERVRAELEKTP